VKRSEPPVEISARKSPGRAKEPHPQKSKWH
jgi:hypothetical protein